MLLEEGGEEVVGGGEVAPQRARFELDDGGRVDLGRGDVQLEAVGALARLAVEPGVDPLPRGRSVGPFVP